VHTARELTGASFAITVGGEPAGLDAVLPGFTDRDRVGVVARRPHGALGASALILAAVTAFYDLQRERGEPFFIYPDYFVFHVGTTQGDHRKLDIWPSHKEVVVKADAEALLEAINDRAITRLVVEDGEPAAPRMQRETVASARSRIATCLAYAPSGRVRDGAVAIAGNDVTEGYVAATLERAEGTPPAAREAAAAARRGLREDGRPVETYRVIALDEALGLLAAIDQRTAAPPADLARSPSP
jgi:hypothetical protein